MPVLGKTQLLLWICALVVLEINHLKWIWWTQWSCSKCGRKNEDCSCDRTKWMTYL